MKTRRDRWHRIGIATNEYQQDAGNWPKKSSFLFAFLGFECRTSFTFFSVTKKRVSWMEWMERASPLTRAAPTESPKGIRRKARGLSQ
eukprot:scaffold7095_cov128-Skeletonema_menzelii.AAC.1